MTSPACAQCGNSPVVRDGLCVECYAQQQMNLTRQRLRNDPPVEQDQLDLLLTRWNLAATTQVEWRRDKGEAFDERFRGYEVELRLIQPIGQALFYPWQIDTAGKPSQMTEPSGEVAIINPPRERLAILRMRIWREPRRGFLEGWWERNLRAIRWSIRDIDEQTGTKDLDALLKLLRTHAKLGRPFGDIFGNREGLIVACRAAKTELSERLEKRVSQVELATQLYVTPRTLQNALKRYDLRWKDILDL